DRAIQRWRGGRAFAKLNQLKRTNALSFKVSKGNMRAGSGCRRVSARWGRHRASRPRRSCPLTIFLQSRSLPLLLSRAAFAGLLLLPACAASEVATAGSEAG